MMLEEDLAIIRAHGVPLRPDPRFVIVKRNRTARLTPRGRQIYRVAMLMYGLSPEPVEAVQTLADLREITLKVKNARLVLVMDELERKASAGKIPARSREIVNALIYGSLEDFQAAVEHRLACDVAGQNVIPFPAPPR